MGIREKITPKNLNVQQYFIRTNNRQNPYLLITGLDDVVGSGVYSFIIHGSSFLLQDSEVRFEAIDSRGNQISIAGVRNILKGNSRVVSFTIDDTIEDGEATIYVAAVLEDYLTDRGLVESVPQQFSGDENLLFTFRFDIDKEKNNNDEIIFKRPPVAVVTPKIKKVRTITKPDVSETVTEAEIVRTFYNSSRRELQVTVFDETGTKFKREMDGKEVTITNADIDLPGTKIFTAGRKNTALFKIPNPDVSEYTGTELISLLPDAVGEEENAKLSFTIDYNRLAQYNLVKLQEAAFATFDFRNLTTVSGDVEKIRIYGKSDTLQTDYNLINEYELLGQNSLVLEDIGNIGIFDTDDKLSNWNVSTVTTSSVLTPTIERDESILSAGVIINENGLYSTPEKKEVNGTELQTPRYKFQSDTNLILRKDTEYFIRFKAAVLEVPEPDTRLDVYIVSDYLSGENNSIGKLIGSIRTNSNDVWEEGVEMILTNESDIIDGKIAFVNTTGRWILSDIEISSKLQKGFSPAEYKVDVPVDVKKDKQDIDFRVEFLDADDNKASIGLQIDNVIFDRPNLVIEGFDNFLSGSLFVGEATSSGIGLGLSDAGGAFIKSVPYDGFIDATTGGQSGFLLYSGSVTSSVEDEYSGSLGVEIVKDEDNYLRFRTEPSLFEVKSDVFFFGNADTQFISGSNSNIEISASNFHLDPKNNLLILRGAIRQDSNGVELSDFRNRGTWSAGNIYLVNDLVQYEFNDITQTYIAETAHTSSASDPDGPPEPDTSNNWAVFASGGTDGADGADGADGVDSRAVNLISSDQSIEYDENGGNPDPSSVTITANAINTTGTVYYQFFLNDVSQQNTTSNTFSLTPESSIDNMPQKVEVQIREGSDSSGILARDQVTIFGIQDGSDAYTVILTNEAHTLPTTNTGTVTYTGSGTSVIVYKGTTELNGITSGTPTTGQFSATVSATNITAGSQTSTGNPIVFGDASNMTADNASIEFTINAEDVASITKIQSFAKSIQGDNGVDGDDGAPGPGVVFRGEYDTTGATTYFASTTRRDVVEGSNGQYYLCKLTHTGAADKEPITGGSYTTYWETFGATFSSVATDILFAQDVYANRTINIGTQGTSAAIQLYADNDPSPGNNSANPYITIGQGGSPGFNNNGIFLGYDEVTPGVTGTPKLSLVGSDSLTWNGNSLNLTGTLDLAGSDVINRDGSFTLGNGTFVFNGTSPIKIIAKSNLNDVPLEIISEDDENQQSLLKFTNEAGQSSNIGMIQSGRFIIDGDYSTLLLGGNIAPVLTTGTIKFVDGGGSNSLIEVDSSTNSVRLYHNGNERLETNANGIQLSGLGTSSETDVLVVDSSGNVTKNTSFSGGSTLTLDDVTTNGNTTTNSISVGNVDATLLRSTGDIIAFYSSDENLKDNIISIKDATQKIKQIGGYEFDWNDKQNVYEGHDVGVIAQEVEKVLPEVVQTRKDGYKAVKYEKLVPLLIESIKELTQRVEELERRD